MAKNDLENELQNLKNIHLTESELAAYCDQELGLMHRARVESHVKQCFRCREELAVLLEESDALNNWRADVRKSTSSEPSAQPRVSPDELSTTRAPRSAGASLSDRLAAALWLAVEDWRLAFGQMKPVHRRGKGGREVWRMKREEGVLKAWAVLEKNADLRIHFSSNELGLEGARLKVGLGAFNQEMILERVSESEVHAGFTVPKQKRPKDLSKISVEIV